MMKSEESVVGINKKQVFFEVLFGRVFDGDIYGFLPVASLITTVYTYISIILVENVFGLRIREITVHNESIVHNIIYYNAIISSVLTCAVLAVGICAFVFWLFNLVVRFCVIKMRLRYMPFTKEELEKNGCKTVEDALTLILLYRYYKLPWVKKYYYFEYPEYIQRAQYDVLKEFPSTIDRIDEEECSFEEERQYIKIKHAMKCLCGYSWFDSCNPEEEDRKLYEILRQYVSKEFVPKLDAILN